MSVKHSLLALLSEGPRYGAALRSEFEERTGGTWPLNVGQVYTTLGRLERDGLVVKEDGAAPGEDTSTIRYAVTPAGLAEVRRWWVEPVDRASTPRQELAIKLALAVTVEGIEVPRLVQVQRRATMQHLQELTRLKRTGPRDVGAAAGGGTAAEVPSGNDLAWSLVLDNLIFTAEAELRWLDHVEARVTRAAGAASRRTTPKGDVASPAVTEHDAQAPGTGPARSTVTAGDRKGGRR